MAVADAISPDDPVHILGRGWWSVAAWEAMCDPHFACSPRYRGPAPAI